MVKIYKHFGFVEVEFKSLYVSVPMNQSAKILIIIPIKHYKKNKYKRVNTIWFTQVTKNTKSEMIQPDYEYFMVIGT